MSQTATFLYMSHIVCYFSLVIKKDLLLSTVFCFAGVNLLKSMLEIVGNISN